MTSTTRTLTAPQLRPSTVLLAIAAVVLLGVALGLLAQPSTGTAVDGLPASFPVPDGARQVETLGEVVTLDVPGTAADVHDFYGQTLPDKGWKADPWEGTDPNGAAATGFIIQRDRKIGALSIIENGPSVTVEINLNQPANRTDNMGSHGNHGAPADAPADQ